MVHNVPIHFFSFLVTITLNFKPRHYVTVVLKIIQTKIRILKMLKAREQLDLVLRFFYDMKDVSRGVTDDDVARNSDLIKTTGNKSELERILLKLRNDKYLQMWPDYPILPNGDKDMKDGMKTFWSITFDGRLFWEDGGYTKEAEVILKVEKIKNSREKRLSDGTVLLAIGTFLLVLWEIIKTFCIEKP
jgi:hypothetical protein